MRGSKYRALTGKILCFGEVVAYKRGGATLGGSTAEAFLWMIALDK